MSVNPLRWLGWVLLCAALAGFWTGASATTVTLSSFPPNPGVMPGGGWQFSAGTTFANPPPPRAWVNGVYGGVPKFIATDSFSLAGRAGALPVAAASSVGMADAAAAVARCLVGANALCAAGTAAYMLYKGYRVYEKSQVPGSTVPNGSLDYDPGTPQVQDGVCALWSRGSWSGCFADSNAAVAAYKAAAVASAPGLYANGTGQQVPAQCGIAYQGDTVFRLTSGPGGSYCPSAFTSEVGRGGWQANMVCPASVDALNPAYSIPAGMPAGADGKCPTARYNHQGVTPTQASTTLMAQPPTLPNAGFGQALQDAIASGQSTPSDLTTSGPASQTGPSQTVTVTNSGNTTTTTTTPTYNYNYAGNTISYTTTVTTTVNNAGNVTTTTTNGVPATAQDPTDPCTANPNRLGCMSLDTPPPAEAIPRSDAPISYTPTIFANNPSCPPDVPLAINVGSYSHTFAISYGPLCSTLQTLAPLFLALAAVTAAYIFMEALKA